MKKKNHDLRQYAHNNSWFLDNSVMFDNINTFKSPSILISLNKYYNYKRHFGCQIKNISLCLFPQLFTV